MDIEQKVRDEFREFLGKSPYSMEYVQRCDMLIFSYSSWWADRRDQFRKQLDEDCEYIYSNIGNFVFRIRPHTVISVKH
jgi:hypothetical protein